MSSGPFGGCREGRAIEAPFLKFYGLVLLPHSSLARASLFHPSIYTLQLFRSPPRPHPWLRVSPSETAARLPLALTQSHALTHATLFKYQRAPNPTSMHAVTLLHTNPARLYDCVCVYVYEYTKRESPARTRSVVFE